MKIKKTAIYEFINNSLECTLEENKNRLADAIMDIIAPFIKSYLEMQDELIEIKAKSKKVVIVDFPGKGEELPGEPALQGTFSDPEDCKEEESVDTQDKECENPDEPELPHFERLYPYVDDETFWKEVDRINWRFICEDEDDRVYKEVKEDLIERYGSNEKDLNTKMYHFTKALLDHIERYVAANYNKKWINFWKDCGFVHGLSDDSFWYLCTFIVGCGKKEYDRVMLDPTRVSEFKDYQEGFAYCF